MLRTIAIGLIMTSVLFATNAQAVDESIRFASGIGALKLFMRHSPPTAPRRGPPVLILHGATFPSGNAAGWKIDGRSWMDELASAGYDVYALDFLGYGESDRYPEMSADVAAGAPLGNVGSMVVQVDAAVEEILRARGARTVNLVAHSAGTYVAARYAQLHPERVERLVLFGAPAPYKNGSFDATPAVRFAQVGRIDQLDAFESRVREGGQLDLAMFDRWAQAYLATDARSANRNPPSVRVPSGMLAAVDAMHRSGQLPYDPSRISAPTLVIQGEWDAVAPPAAGLWVYERLGAALKRFVVISQAGHRAHLERNRWQLYKETESFLEGGDEAGPVYAVFFEVKPKDPKGKEDYLAEARVLRPHLATMSGFLDVERFESATRPGWLLSLSRWRDESSLVAWREVFEHRQAQEKGRHGIFEDYRIRVAREVGRGGDLVLTDDTGSSGTGSGQAYISLSDAHRHVKLVEDPALATGTHWQVIRDYGMHERRQAPHE